MVGRFYLKTLTNLALSEGNVVLVVIQAAHATLPKVTLVIAWECPKKSALKNLLSCNILVVILEKVVGILLQSLFEVKRAVFVCLQVQPSYGRVSKRNQNLVVFTVNVKQDSLILRHRIQYAVFLWNLKAVNLLALAKIPYFKEPIIIRYKEIAVIHMNYPHNRRQNRHGLQELDSLTEDRWHADSKDALLLFVVES